MTTPTAAGTIQLFDRYLPGLEAGDYLATVQQTIPGVDTGGYLGPRTQAFTVRGPRFSLPSGDVGEMYPPPDSSGPYGTNLPSVVLHQRTLPWARALTADPACPWMALLSFRAAEMVPDPATGLPLRSGTVAGFLADTATLGPVIDRATVPADVLASTVTSIVVPLTVFTAVAPSLAELPYLAHVRRTDTTEQAASDAAQDGWYAVVLGNRFPDPATAVDGSGTLTVACLVSLEGLTGHLPGGTGSPAPAGSAPNLRLAVLASWPFVTDPAGTGSFARLMAGLAGGSAADPAALLPRLPVPPQAPATAAAGRLADGYAPLAARVASGEDTFAWYRGPCSPVVPQPLPPPTGGNGHYASSAEVTIYLPGQGLFDFSYAAAFEAGRLAALADRAFAVALVNARRTAFAALSTLSARLQTGQFAGQSASEVLAPKPAWRGFARALRAGMGDRLTAAIAQAPHAPAVPATPAAPRSGGPPPADPMAATRALLARDDVRALLAAQVDDGMDTVTDWLAQLALLHGVPFRHLVPDERMLPVESARLFYLDPGWIAALLDGALSVGVEGSRDLELAEAWSAPLTSAVAAKVGAVRAVRRNLPGLTVDTAPRAVTAAAAPASAPPLRSGLLVRSAVVAGWPGLVVQADGGATPLLRLDRLSPSVLLAIFDGVPGTVTLGEPRHGLRFGVADDNLVHLRLPGGAAAGATVPAAGQGDIFSACLRPVTGGAGGRVLAVGSLASALGAALAPYAPGVPMGSALFATELVQAPQQLTFGGPAAPPPAPPPTVIQFPVAPTHGPTGPPSTFPVLRPQPPLLPPPTPPPTSLSGLLPTFPLHLDEAVTAREPADEVPPGEPAGTPPEGNDAQPDKTGE